MANNKFTHFRQPRPCRVCGKNTTYHDDDCGNMCETCYNAAGAENEHYDGYHVPGSDRTCPICHPELFPGWK